MNIICNNENSNYKDTVLDIINSKKKEIFSFFLSNEVKLDFNIYIYDSVESLISGLKDRGFDDTFSCMCGCYKDSDNSLNFFEPKDNPSNKEWSKEEYTNVIFHELIHSIQYTLFGSTPKWLNEGIAKYLDGTYKKGIKWLFENYIHKSLIPDQQEIEEEFGKHNYDSCDYAFVMVSYLIENMGKKSFLGLLKDKSKIDEVKKNLLIKSICYYNKKFFNNEYFNQDLNNPQWLFHGSPKMLEKLVPQLSHDSDNNKVNIDNAVFVTSSFMISSAYSFKDTIKEFSSGLKYGFSISNYETRPVMTMENVKVLDNFIGYIYVFVNDGTFKNDPTGSLQFKSYKELIPVFVKEIQFKDYKELYEIK